MVEAIFNTLLSVMVYSITMVILSSFGVNVYGQAVALVTVAVIKNYLIRRVANLGDIGGRNG